MTSDISKIQKGKYKNLICDDFSASLEDIEGVYNIEIQNNNDYLKKSLVENLKIMDTTINRFSTNDFLRNHSLKLKSILMMKKAVLNTLDITI